MASKKRILALDLGSSSYKMVLMEAEGSHSAIAASRVAELPAQADAHVQAAALRSLLEGIRADRLDHVVSVVDDSFACVRQILTPLMPAGELQEAVRWELQRFLAVPPEEMWVDYERLEEVEADQKRKLKLLAGAFPSAAIREHLNLLAQAGVKPTQLMPKVVALAQWSRCLPAEEGDQPVALLELGRGGSEFVVVHGGRPLFNRKIPVGGCELTRAMTAVLMTTQGQVGLTEAEAETVKRGIGIPGEDTSETVTKGISKIQLLSLLRGGLERLAVEVERSLAFYGESHPAGAVERLLLVGGGGNLKGLDGWLEQRLGIRVGVPRDAAQSDLSLVPALGAAHGAGRGLNLLPAEWKEAARIRVQRAALTGAATAVVLGLALLWIGLQVYRQSLAMQVAALRIQKHAVEAELPAARAAVSAHQQLRSDPSCEEFFRKVSVLTPAEVYLTDLALQDKEVSLRGRIRRGGAGSEQVLGQFMKTLKEELFTDVQLKSSRQMEGTGGGVEFEVGGRLP